MASSDRTVIIGLNADGTLALGGPWALQEIKGNSKIGDGEATSTVQSIAAPNTSRKALIVVNIGLDTIWIGPDASVGTDTGFPIPPGGYFMDNITIDGWWGVCATTANWRSLEV